MASRKHSSDHRHYRVRGRMTAKRARVANQRGGERSVPGTNHIAGCPFCQWRRSDKRKQDEPVSITVATLAMVLKCPAGHQWRRDGWPMEGRT